MSLRECQRKHTFREYKTWMHWLDAQWDHPTITEHYLMQVAAEVKRVLAKDPSKIHTKDFKLKFVKESSKKEPVKPSEEELAARTAASKSFWGSLISAARKLTNGDRDRS